MDMHVFRNYGGISSCRITLYEQETGRPPACLLLVVLRVSDRPLAFI
ncbi:MAG TPA: hypothetical protein VKK79_14545 [Candidatus Lokiarchaeia archaeon]|nr:hypothetical protein [Candidatus Lokiarchaeia archaeon]